MLSFFSSRRNWDFPTPLAEGECAPSPFGPGWRADSLAGEGLGESQSDEGTYTVVLHIYKYFVPWGDSLQLYNDEDNGEVVRTIAHFR